MEERLLEPEFEVVGKVRNGQALFEEGMRLQPDVIVSDISMPILSGIDAAERLKESGCNSRIVFLTVHSDAEFVRRCLFAVLLDTFLSPEWPMSSYWPFVQLWRVTSLFATIATPQGSIKPCLLADGAAMVVVADMSNKMTQIAQDLRLIIPSRRRGYAFVYSTGDGGS